MEMPITENILREPACRQATGLSRATRWRLIRDGKFPAPVPLGARAKGWISSDIANWIESKREERDDAAKASATPKKGVLKKCGRRAETRVVGE